MSVREKESVRDVICRSGMEWKTLPESKIVLINLIFQIEEKRTFPNRKISTNCKSLTDANENEELVRKYGECLEVYFQIKIFKNYVVLS